MQHRILQWHSKHLSPGSEAVHRVGSLWRAVLSAQGREASSHCSCTRTSQGALLECPGMVRARDTSRHTSCFALQLLALPRGKFERMLGNLVELKQDSYMRDPRRAPLLFVPISLAASPPECVTSLLLMWEEDDSRVLHGW
eukprot:327602-Amphidinium_carterae.1